MANSFVSLAGDRVLAIAQADAARVYRDLSPYRIQLVLEDDGWHVDYDLKNPGPKAAGGTISSTRIREGSSPSSMSNCLNRQCQWWADRPATRVPHLRGLSDLARWSLTLAATEGVRPPSLSFVHGPHFPATVRPTSLRTLISRRSERRARASRCPLRGRCPSGCRPR
jgi:hypothetical protein